MENIIIAFLSINIVSFNLYGYYSYNYIFYMFLIINVTIYIFYFKYIKFISSGYTYLNPVNFINNFLKLYDFSKVSIVFINLFYISLAIFFIFISSTFITGFDLTETLPFYSILEPIVFYIFIIIPFIFPIYGYLKIKLYKKILYQYKDNQAINFFIFIDSVILLFLFILIYRTYLFLLFLK